MKVGITVRFLNSYFSGGIPQVACSLAKALQNANHDVTLLYPAEEQDWFVDVLGYKSQLPPRKPWSPKSTDRYDAVFEVVWSFPTEDRPKVATHRILWVHQPPIFHDIESSVYNWNPTQRSFANISAIATYDFYSAQDVHYLEFLSGVQVIQVPFLWNPEALDIFCKENKIPEWRESARRIEALIPKETHQSVSWCARIVESNFSNTSHCNVPLNILTQIRVRGDPVRFNVHNGEQLVNNDFFNTNIVKNLLLPDISGSIVPRVRLPDLRQEKSFIISHQRFRPLKMFMLDALYLGIPLIHNCELLTEMGAPYGYKLNQIMDATNAWAKLKKDYENNKILFNAEVRGAMVSKLSRRFSPVAMSPNYNDILKRAITPKSIPKSITSHSQAKELRIHFCELWSEFVPKYNFFMYLLSWIGVTNNIPVILDSKNPNLVIYGPLSNGAEKAYPGISKVWFTGENTPPPNNPDIVLSLGFQYNTASNYIRLPLWMIEVNWFGGDPNKIVNPRPVSVQAATTVDQAVIDNKSKFCAFVATNPNNNNRNVAFQILNSWKPVDSAGRLMCNRPEGPIPAGLGGGGGELAKVDYYKDYKYVITYENSAGPGYTTEKLFHAKVAGAVPIYWGDPFVDRDFDSTGFINTNQVSKPEDLIAAIKKVEDDPALWRKMALVPAISATKKGQCEQTMEQVGQRIFKVILDVEVKVDSWAKAESFGKMYETMSYSQLYAQQPTPIPTPASAPASAPQRVQPPLIIPITSPRVFVTAANARYLETAVNVVASMKSYEPDIVKIVYVWHDVTEEHCNILKQYGATEVRRFPEQHGPWQDFWNPQHFAWKLWLHIDVAIKSTPGTLVLYMDSGIALAAPITNIWATIQEKDIFLLDDVEHLNERWCHPTFCRELQVVPDELKSTQIWAGCIGFKVGGKYIESVHKQALGIAENKREVIVGEKWSPYSQVCLGHRHDQSILSVLTHRAGAPRIPLKEFYCDRSMRTAKQWNTPLYVHRGNFKDIVPFTDGIDEAYVINLERRKDRLEKFKEAHKNIKDRVYLWRATDGRTLTLTPELVNCFRDNDFKWKKSVMGCAISHLGLWEKLANDKLAKSYLIMEDDVVLFDRWILRWMTAAKHIPADADVIYLGGVLPPNKESFASVAEGVNEYFGRVAPNTLFSSHPRRYFHFCNYAYVLTQQGARKLITLVKEKGVFTSGDHMIVNHGDNLLNIYFTLPLLATCYQENDPIYQKSDFNNFNRVDNFDSDLWNNTDCFTKEETFAVLKADIQGNTFRVVGDTMPGSSPMPSAPAPAPAPAVAPAPVADFSLVWNKLLQAALLKNEVDFKPSLDTMLSMWTESNFNSTASYFTMFEQLIAADNEMFMKYKADIYAGLSRNFNLSNTQRWGKILAKIANPVSTDTIPVFYLKTITPNFLENDWLNSVFPKPIRWVTLESFDELVKASNPILLFQNIPGESSLGYIYNGFASGLEKLGKKITILHLSDEFGSDPIDFYKSSAVKRVIRNYFRPNLPMEKVDIIPLGYAVARGPVSGTTPAFADRPYIWSFAGSMDRPFRSQAIQALERTGNFKLAERLYWSDPAKLNGNEYNQLNQQTKFVPCFAGAGSLESYRLYEAIEQGAIPIYVPNGVDSYAEVLGKHPILSFPSWEKAAEILPVLAQNAPVMEDHRRILASWWQGKKAEFKSRLQTVLN